MHWNGGGRLREPTTRPRLLTGFLAAIRNGGGAALSDSVERALGWPPRPFEDYVAATTAAGYWN